MRLSQHAGRISGVRYAPNRSHQSAVAVLVPPRPRKDPFRPRADVKGVSCRAASRAATHVALPTCQELGSTIAGDYRSLIARRQFDPRCKDQSTQPAAEMGSWENA